MFEELRCRRRSGHGGSGVHLDVQAECMMTATTTCVHALRLTTQTDYRTTI